MRDYNHPWDYEYARDFAERELKERFKLSSVKSIEVKQTFSKEKVFLFFKKKKVKYHIQIVVDENEYIADLLLDKINIEEIVSVMPVLINGEARRLKEVSEIIYRNGEIRSEPIKF